MVDEARERLNLGNCPARLQKSLDDPKPHPPPARMTPALGIQHGGRAGAGKASGQQQSQPNIDIDSYVEMAASKLPTEMGGLVVALTCCWKGLIHTLGTEEDIYPSVIMMQAIVQKMERMEQASTQEVQAARVTRIKVDRCLTPPSRKRRQRKKRLKARLAESQ